MLRHVTPLYCLYLHFEPLFFIFFVILRQFTSTLICTHTLTLKMSKRRKWLFFIFGLSWLYICDVWRRIGRFSYYYFVTNFLHWCPFVNLFNFPAQNPTCGHDSYIRKWKLLCKQACKENQYFVNEKTYWRKKWLWF